MPTLYRQLTCHTPIPSPTHLAESKTRYETLTERHLQALWLEQKYFRNLATSDGSPIEIVSPGVWNVESGPDFLHAHLRINGLDLRGDIEIHLAQEGWTSHGHAQDPRYNSVILHLVLWQARTPRPTIRANGAPVHTAYLEKHLTVPIARLLRLIDLELYPYQRFTGTGRCAHELFARIPTENTDRLLRSAARHRLENKVHILREQAPNDSLTAGIAMAAGYKHNARAFLELFTWAKQENWNTRDELFAALLGSCGFFEKNHARRWKESSYYQQLQQTWWLLQPQITHQSHLALHQVRPLNHPVRRLAYLSYLILDPNTQKLEDKLHSFWQWGHHSTEPSLLLNELIKLIPSYPDPYWSQHYTFEQNPKDQTLSLIGTPIRLIIMSNVLLPLLWERISQHPEQIDAFEALYSAIPAEKNRKSLYLRERFFGDSGPTHLLTKAIAEQGAFQLHQDFCVHYEASCEGCPFVERVQALKS